MNIKIGFKNEFSDKEIIAKYQNGNVTVEIYSDGSKHRFTMDDEFHSVFPESMDVNITTVCDGGCPFCYQNGNKCGRHADLKGYKDLINSIHPYTEVALNGNDLSHPDLEWFLKELKNHKVIANMTINQIHFMRDDIWNKVCLWKSMGLIKGLGVSLQNATDEFIKRIKSTPKNEDIVIHAINGIHTMDKLRPLFDKDLKILFLGYKTVGRGVEYKKNVNVHNDLFNSVLGLKNHFKVISFDNLALEQLDLKNRVNPIEWEKRYQGDEGSISFYLDLVGNCVAKSSLETKTKPINSHNIDELFKLATNGK